MKLAVVLPFITLVACAGDAKDYGQDGAISVDGGHVHPDGGGTSFRVVQLAGCGQGGFQTAISSNRLGKVSIATIALVNEKGQCSTMNGDAQVQRYAICYAEREASAQGYGVTTLDTQEYVSLMGVGVAVDDSGQAKVAYPGGPPARLRCGASDLLVKTGRGASFGAPETVATGSASNALVPGMESLCVQNVCQSGDATGFWPAVAIDPTGRPAVAFRDLHFGFAADDFASSDVELARGPSWETLTVDVARGGGSYLRLAFTPDGKPALVHYNGERDAKTSGIWLHRELATGWMAKRLAAVRVGEQLGFAISKSGRYAVAYYDEERARLMLLESADGESFGEAQDVDTTGITGLYPSLAFGEDGEPAIAYYRCNDFHPTDRSCDPNKDGLWLARRASGRWVRQQVLGRSGIHDGMYPAIAFSGSRAVVAFQERWFDQASGKSETGLSVATEE
ncbi:MAG: hypothetical protein HY698_06785 [Deltaproteobacteria bacterium]|nr:hypothetical protein [Deltaproteobacteria bacterium]